jgi:hypothetical protein
VRCVRDENRSIQGRPIWSPFYFSPS